MNHLPHIPIPELPDGVEYYDDLPKIDLIMMIKDMESSLRTLDYIIGDILRHMPQDEPTVSKPCKLADAWNFWRVGQTVKVFLTRTRPER